MKNSSVKTRAGQVKTAPEKESGNKKRQWSWASRLSSLFLSFVLTTLILVLERQYGVEVHDFIVGEPSPRTLFSPFEITYTDDDTHQLLREEKSHSVPLIFSREPKILAEATGQIDRLFERIHKVKTENPTLPPVIETAKLPFEVSESALKVFLEEPDLDELRKYLQALIEQTFEQGVGDYSKKMELLEKRGGSVTILSADGKSEKAVFVRDLPTLNEWREIGEKKVSEMVGKKRHLKAPLLEVYHAVLKPNLFENEHETKERRKKAAESVEPIEEKIKKDELIVQRGMLITAPVRLRIDQIQKKLAEHKILNQLFAVGMLVLLTYFLSFIYLLYFEKRVLADLRLFLLIQAVFILTVLLCKMAALWPGSSLYLMPAALAPLMLALLGGSQLGFFGAVVISILISPLAKFDADIILPTLLSGVAGTFATLRVRRRIQFLKVGAASGLAYFLTLLALEIYQEYPFLDALQISAEGLANGLLITMPLCFLLLPLFEFAFNQTTDITLLELSDLNHPLLKRMVVEAPGTYHHSLTVSTLAESACEAIGANTLLARVGCYFHDIGKIARAEFFTENQGEKYAEKHEKLTPTMSCLIIMNHVKDGMELGRKYKLKDRILRFIPEHQGTGVVYYFYKKALDSAVPGERVNPNDYRYPGPKPQSKETAVALLADSTEAASRSLKDPSPESLRQLVRKIINDKFIDGQLDECDLTLRDLYKIQESFIYNLMAIFHTRVRYPATPDSPDDPNLFREDPFLKFRADSPSPSKLP